MSKTTYYSTFRHGSGEQIKTLLMEEINDIEIELISNGFVVFSTSKNITKIAEQNYLTNSYILIKRFDDLKGSYFKPIFQWAGRHPFEDIKKFGKDFGCKSFRIILQDYNKIVSGHRRAIKALERQISNETGIKVDRVNPDTEIWISHTRDGYGFILFKITRA